MYGVPYLESTLRINLDFIKRSVLSHSTLRETICISVARYDREVIQVTVACSITNMCFITNRDFYILFGSSVPPPLFSLRTDNIT